MNGLQLKENTIQLRIFIILLNNSYCILCSTKLTEQLLKNIHFEFILYSYPLPNTHYYTSHTSQYIIYLFFKII